MADRFYISALQYRRKIGEQFLYLFHYIAKGKISRGEMYWHRCFDWHAHDCVNWNSGIYRNSNCCLAHKWDRYRHTHCCFYGDCNFNRHIKCRVNGDGCIERRRNLLTHFLRQCICRAVDSVRKRLLCLPQADEKHQVNCRKNTRETDNAPAKYSSTHALKYSIGAKVKRPVCDGPLVNWKKEQLRMRPRKERTVVETVLLPAGTMRIVLTAVRCTGGTALPSTAALAARARSGLQRWQLASKVLLATEPRKRGNNVHF